MLAAYKIIGVVDHRSDFLWRYGTIEIDGVPVLLVHVITGPNCAETFPQLDGSFGIAFEIDRRRVNVEKKEKKDLLGDLENKGVFPKRKTFCDFSTFPEAILAESVDGHKSPSHGGGD